MGIWDDDDFSFEEEENPYLSDAEKGIELIAKLLHYDKKNMGKKKMVKKLDYLLDRKLFDLSSKVNLADELKMYDRIVQLSDKLYEQNKLKLLKNKSVIGIGGKFSAGKSKFINALINNDILPEDQTPTTSIATYIVKAESEEVRAYTYQDQDILLDMQAAQALTHAFYKKYKIGFSQFVNNLVIHVPDFLYPNIALLDTPGYSKADSGVKRNATDAERAFHQLKSVDYLIWLADIENGVIQQADIDFMRNLNLRNPILVVFNKVDKKTKRDAEAILQTSKEILAGSGLNIYACIAYSALQGEEYFGSSFLKQFLEKVNGDVKRNEDIDRQIQEIYSQIQTQLSLEKKRLVDQRNKIGNIIFRSEDVMEIRTLVRLYGEVLKDIREINYYSYEMESMKEKINSMLRTI